MKKLLHISLINWYETGNGWAVASIIHAQQLYLRLHFHLLLFVPVSCVSDNGHADGAYEYTRVSSPISKRSDNCASLRSKRTRLRKRTRRAERSKGQWYTTVPYHAGQTEPRVCVFHYIARPDAIKWEIAFPGPTKTSRGGRPEERASCKERSDILHGSCVFSPGFLPRSLAHSPCTLRSA